MKKKISVILVLVLLFLTVFSVNVFAASNTVLSWSGVKTYATKSINVYKTSGTTKSSGEIDNGDCITIKSYHESSKRFVVTYTVTRGKNKGDTATGYIKASDIGYALSNKPSKIWKVAYGYDVKGYTRSSQFNKSLTFSAGTEIYEFGNSGDYISAVGKVSGTYWLVFVKKADVRKLPSISSTKTYKIASKINNNYVLDVKDGSKKANAGIQLYKWNGTSAQVFQFSLNSSNNSCWVKNYHSKMYFGIKDNNLVQNYFLFCSDFYIAEDFDGYIMFKHRNTGKFIDVSGGKATNGTKIQLYKFNNTASQKFKLMEVLQTA
ncbi:MAG: RICIN domain-containing protein [Acutalibacteraceae bacterium]